MERNFFRNFTLTCALVCFCAGLMAQVSPKRGLAYGYHSTADINTIAPGTNGISWWYNWSDVPDAAIAGYYQSIGVEFVPMVWGGTFNQATVIANIRSDAKYLLAFNEPNFTVQANLTPAQAVSLWPQIEAIANAKNLEIVSVSAAYGGDMAGYGSAIAWQDQFFALCPTCRVDYIAFHAYDPTAASLIGVVNTMKKYGRPIWVTEFALWAADSPANKLAYLQTAVNTFENDPDIYRYSWFSGRVASNPSIDIFGAGSGTLTALGTAYRNAAYGPQTTIPGKVEAERYYRRRGTNTENTTDAGGGQNIGWTDPGTWGEYIIDVPATGSHNFTFRVASALATGRFDILVDDVVVRTNIAVPNTGGWQTWTDLPVTGIVLTSGEHLVKLRFTGAGINLNYFNINFNAGVPASADFSAAPLNTCVGNNIIFTDQTTNKSGTETYAWNFGAGATPATATGAGPHTVTYSSGGQKTPGLTVTNQAGPNTMTKTNYITIAAPPAICIFSDDFNNNTVNWITPVPGAFSHSESGTTWTISNAGYGEWEYFNYLLNNGTVASPMNFSCAANKPIFTIRAKASANALLRATLMDGTGKIIDNISVYNMELTTAYQTFSIDFSGKFRNYYGAAPGILDSSNITTLQFTINQGYASFPQTGVNGIYNTYFAGNVDIEWMGIGNNCNAALPVELTNFTAALQENHYKLLWRTVSEKNNDYFIIEKSNDGIAFKSIGKVNGKGSSSSVTNYAFEDYTLVSGIAYYRLKQVDYNGEYTYSEIINVSADISSDRLVAYPNPADGNNFIIECTGSEEEKTIEIYNLLGEVLFSKKLYRSDLNIRSQDLPFKLEKGIYIIKKANSNSIYKLVIN
ncbi:MAG: carbohydrate-binding protein [Cytophagaceae bacterium]|nr:carbohydrate-binding protein [Cytophagaceae bacterium]